MRGMAKDLLLTPVIKWLGIMAFFAIMPVIFLKFAEFVLKNISAGAVESGGVQEFSNDLPMIILSFWAGSMGSIVLYAYQRTQNEIASKGAMVPIARLLFGGIVGAASLFFLQSAVVIKILYPKVNLSEIGENQLSDYRSVVAVAVLCGLLSPLIVRNMRSRFK